MRHIYLCGQITGASYSEARFGWRADVFKALDGRMQTEHDARHGLADVRCLSPMRNKEHLSDDQALSPLGKADSVLSCPRGITTRDLWDIRRSTLIFANLDMGERVSIGCSVEIGYAAAVDVPVIAVMPEGNPHDHAMVRELVGWRVQTVDEGIEVAKALLNEVL